MSGLVEVEILVTLTLVGPLARLVVLVPGGGGGRVLGLVLLRVRAQQLPGEHGPALLGLLVEVAAGHVAARVDILHPLLHTNHPILAMGHPQGIQFLRRRK